MTDEELQRLSREELIRLVRKQTRETKRLRAALDAAHADAATHANGEAAVGSTAHAGSARHAGVSLLDSLPEVYVDASGQADASAHADAPAQTSSDHAADEPDKGGLAAQLLEAEAEQKRSRQRYRAALRGTLGTLAVVAAVAVLVATLLLPVLRIYGSSMEPTLSAGDIVASVKGAQLETGDVVGFYYQNSVLVKRVIATAGDWVDIAQDGTVSVNGQPLDEPYLPEKAYGTVDIDLPYQVPEGRVFVMGDHRSTSVDSRTQEIGCVAEENLIGKIEFRIWPLTRFGFIG